jgi:endonuclease YncB( thermonuclease family)
MIPALFLCAVAAITDGDTLRCEDGTRVRLAGISARERNGTCLRSHPCPAASAEEATAALRRIVAGQTLRCQATGMTFGRVAAWCWSGRVDVSCAMVRSGTVAVWARYWRGHGCD